MAPRSLCSTLCVLLVAVLVMAVSMPHHAPVSTDALTVHVVCHTHDDVGWLKTVDQYFVGLNNSSQHAMVQYILDTVIHQLDENSNRTFVYVEQAFFQRWWRQATAVQQATTKRVVANGQLEFINGGWCMHDEATTHYVDMVDQTTLGHTFLMEEFGVTPRIGWQIDPFGHSATQAALLSAEVGFDALFFGRIDYQDHDLRMSQKNMEFVWRASESLGPTAQVFSGAFQSGNYGPPDGLCFDYFCGDQQVQADPALEDYNLDERVETFVRDAMNYASNTRGNLDTMNIMFTMGSDFQHENSAEWYKSLDKLIDAVNKDGRVKAMYSTPSRYVAAKNAEPVQWTVKTDDFFPYADGSTSYWTGYFSSRVALKRYVRQSSAFLQLARQLELFTGGDGTATEQLWEAQSVAQHHDAVSGTEKQHVAYDYAFRIARGSATADAMVQKALGQLVTPSGTPPSFSSCPLSNISVCEASQAGNNLVVVLYNARARPVTDIVFVPVNQSKPYSVVDSNNKPVPAYVYPVVKTPANDVAGAAPYTLAFEATVPGLGASTYFILFSSSETDESSTVVAPAAAATVPVDREIPSPHSFALMSSVIKSGHAAHPKEQKADATLTITNGLVTLTFDSNGALQSATNVTSGITYPLTFAFGYYQAYQGNGQDDGAYIFLPDGTPAVNFSTPTLLSVTQSNVMSELTVSFADWLFLTVRLRNGHASIEFQYSVGSVPIDDGIGKNVFVRYTSQIASQQIWFTDSNGRELQQRKRNYRPTWNWNPTEPVSGNYYPVNALVGLTDFNSSAMSVAVDRSHGCSSLQDGEIEIMVHRRLLVDDGRGVGEPLNETMGGITQDGTRIGPGLRVTGTHYVHIGDLYSAAQVGRGVQNRIFQPLHASFAPLTTSVTDYVSTHTTSFSYLQTALPDNVELMTLQARGDGTVLVRLAHQFGVNEDAGAMSNDATVDLATLFVQKVSSVTELSLSANQPAGMHMPYTWNTTNSASSSSSSNVRTAGGVNGKPLEGTQVTLSPLQIRTFALTL